MFKDDVAFLRQHTKVVVLSSANGNAQVAVNPDLQGRVMTSTAGGPDGLSFGWINRAALASKENNLHMNAFGGEDRFWLGPEGGQFSIFFKKDDPFDLEHWFTPPPVNEGAWEVIAQASDRIKFRKAMKLLNYSRTEFELEVVREIRLLGPDDFAGTNADGVGWTNFVAFETNNTVTNVGAKAWRKETGLLSVWILGMFNPSPETTVVVPFVAGPEGERGPVVNDAYFGKVPADRLLVDRVRGVLFFRADGQFRSKIGIPPRRVAPDLGSYDAGSRTLTLVRFTLPAGVEEYVNSMWEIQKNPYGGDVVNSYNDGPPAPGAKPLGPFYELETSSPALALEPGESYTHTHATMHFQGPRGGLDGLARKLFLCGLDEIERAFKK
ncbi:MAG: hypothetical protein FJY80_00625 [Candidatus Aminicenantes bacterium]|nr:hypothetical protein [Candidatus Aminicenantes bacterium]